MKASSRREEIARMASSNGLASVEELAATFDVTPSTIRRDLALLTESGRLARTYGGVIALPPRRESPLTERSAEGHDAKRAIGRWAAGMVHANDTILLDAGTTTAQVAHALHGIGPLTVATTGLTPLAALSGAAEIKVICLGGHYREISQSFIGPLTETALESITFDAAFLGADAVTADRGLCEATLAQTRLKRLMARAAQRVYVLAHAAKLGARPFNAWTALDPSWTVVTDSGATPDQLAPFREAGVEVVVVDAVH